LANRTPTRRIPLTTVNGRRGRMSESQSTNWSLDWLYQQLEKKASIIDGISDALMLPEASTYKILDVNRAFFRLYRVSRDEVTGNTCQEITHPLTLPCSQNLKHDQCPLESSVSTSA
jgi:PAS domain-containing protein